MLFPWEKLALPNPLGEVYQLHDFQRYCRREDIQFGGDGKTGGEMKQTYKLNLKNMPSCCLQINHDVMFEGHWWILWSYPSLWSNEIQCLFEMGRLSLGATPRKRSGLSHRVRDPQPLAFYSQSPIPFDGWVEILEKQPFGHWWESKTNKEILKISAPKEVQKRSCSWLPSQTFHVYGDSDFYKKGEENSSLK